MSMLLPVLALVLALYGKALPLDVVGGGPAGTGQSGVQEASGQGPTVRPMDVVGGGPAGR